MSAEKVLVSTSRYLRTLYAVERAHAIGDPAEAERLLAAVDPIDLYEQIALLEVLDACARANVTLAAEAAGESEWLAGSDRRKPTARRITVDAGCHSDHIGGEPARDETAGEASTSSNSASEASTSHQTEPPFAPVHALDNWSRRVHTPCR